MLSAIDIVCRQITVTRTVLQDIAMPLLTSFIDGRYVPERADAERFETIDPATGEVLAEVQAATDADIDTALESSSAKMVIDIPPGFGRALERREKPEIGFQSVIGSFNKASDLSFSVNNHS